MSMLSDDKRQDIIKLLRDGKELPFDYRDMLFPTQKREYELIYANKERREDILSDTMAVPLQPIRTFGTGELNEHNMLIFGDNLQAMKTLLRMKEQGQLVNADGSLGVKCVYIDPPFATKEEYKGEERAYYDKVVGAQFVEFLRKRLIFLHELLAHNGSIFVHLDWKKGQYIKVLLDEIFTEQRFENEIIWHYSDNFQGNVNRFPNNHNVIYLYSRSKTTRFKRVAIPLNKTTKRDVRIWDPETRSVTAARDEEGNILYKDFTHKWADDVWEIGQSSVTKKKSAEYTGYPTQKPEEILKRALEAATDQGDWVLDAFAGSGTTLAISEKLGRRWIGIDCGKLAIYSIQKRMLNLKEGIGNKGKALSHKPFTLYNAGLYDFSQLKKLPWGDWRFFALNLFQCQDQPHKIGGIKLDGYYNGSDVLVFNHTLGGVLDESTIDDVHDQIGSKLGARFFIIASAASVNFLQDYIDRDDTRYYVLRIPYSIINELHNRDFEALLQPISEDQVNDVVDVVGFDFIRTPQAECDYFIHRESGTLFDNAVVRINTFKSRSMAKGASQRGNLETLSMVLVDYDYPHDPNRTGRESPPAFQVDDVFYASNIEKDGWQVRMPYDSLGEYALLIYIDIYGNEYTEVKRRTDFESNYVEAITEE